MFALEIKSVALVGVLLLVMARYAVFGDSYVRRLRDFRDFSLNMDGEVRFFCLGGMRVHDVPDWLWSKLMQYQATHVFINLGGNDVSINSCPRAVAERILGLIEALAEAGATHVVVGEILQRDDFRKSPGLTAECYEKQRHQINKIIQRRIGRQYVHFKLAVHQKNGKLHGDYDRDRVHLSKKGLKKYLYTIKRAFKKSY